MPAASTPAFPVPIVVLMPVYNDWEAAAAVVQALDRGFARIPGAQVSILFVDDWSSPSAEPVAFAGPRQSLESIEVLRLKRNVGSQRAIAIGLAYLYDRGDGAAVLVMDSDGEDKPEDAATLVEHYLTDSGNAIFAERRRRFEGAGFALGYHLYRFVHWLLTGISVRIGNFSILPRSAAGAIVLTGESWSHYAASAVKARISMTRLPLDRGRRIAGQSRMTLIGLVIHGLSAISVFREVVGTRLIIASVIASTIGCGLVGTLGVLIFAHRIPFDRLTATLLLLTILAMAQGVVASFAIAFSVLTGNVSAPIVPGRDYHTFVESVTALSAARAAG